jgi:hypothetical protein
MWTREGSTVADTSVALHTDALLAGPLADVVDEPDPLERRALPTIPPTTPATSAMTMPITMSKVEGRRADADDGGVPGGIAALISVFRLSIVRGAWMRGIARRRPSHANR